MASATRLPLMKLSVVAVLAIGVSLFRISPRALVTRTLTGPGSTSRIITIILLLANAKNTPFSWHYRVFHAFITHFLFSNHKFEPSASGRKAIGPAALFQPIITSSRSPLYECDYNLHKSNSTYFSDLDVTRSHIVCALFRDGIETLKNNHKTGLVKAPDGSTAKGNYFIMLGGTMCSFKREIKPYESYEMWSRILCWDRKWLYIITHFVRKGTVHPDGYTLEAPSQGITATLFGSKKDKGDTKKASISPEALMGTLENKNIYASALSKYVTKIGRLTVHPEVYIEASGLLPPKPGGWAKMSGTSTPSSGTETSSESMGSGTAVNETAAPSVAESMSDEEQWDWKRIEAENARGLKLAQHFAALEGLHEEFTGENRPAVGVYKDFLF